MLRGIRIHTADLRRGRGRLAGVPRRDRVAPRQEGMQFVRVHRIALRARDRWIEAERYTFTLITIYGQAIIARAFAVDDRGQVVPFGAEPR